MYRPRRVWSASTEPVVYPVLVGGGNLFFPHAERRVDLGLVETRTFDSGVVYLRYRVANCSPVL